jgi:anti-sigma regulatory factor (Ser/Thr protein kinase)
MSSPLEHVHLTVPLDARHAATARLVGASLAADAGFTADDIDDLRLGINEAVALLADGDAGEGTRLLIDFRRWDDRLDVELRSTGSSPLALDDLAQRILDTVVTSYRCDGTSISLTSLIPRGGDDGGASDA